MPAAGAESGVLAKIDPKVAMMSQPSKRTQATRNYRQQLGVGIFSDGRAFPQQSQQPPHVSLGSHKNHPTRTNLKSISDMHLQSLTASNVSLKFKNKFSESRKRNNFLPAGALPLR